MDPTERTYAIAAIGPGGASRQIRIQYKPVTDSRWRAFTVCRDSGHAEEELNGLRQLGIQARIVNFRMPAAA